MLETGIILFFSFGYVLLLFAVAHYGDKRADQGRSIISNPYIYTLSLAVYCTAWTYYGSVGRAANTGPDFLTIYLGPTLMFALGWLVLRKILRISKVHHITSIADFVASRYGKSSTLGGMVTIIAVLGVVPYISLQLKAISTSYLIIKHYPRLSMPETITGLPFFQDTAFYVALLLAVFAILFGTRHLDVTERHEGLVAAIAFESIVKLAAFVSVGLFVTYFIYDGFTDLFQQALRAKQLGRLFTIPTGTGTFSGWTMHILLSMAAIVLLPRQFQVTIVENVDEDHLNRAIWLFPLYLLAINIFVVPVALGGVLHFAGSPVDPDTFVLTLPMSMKQEGLALFVYLGGLSAATGMVIVEAIALSTMICNDLAMPILLRFFPEALAGRGDLSSLLVAIRRSSIVLVLLLGYAYFHFIGEYYTLVSIGLVSFSAVAQFAPAILGGLFWKGGTRSGAIWGLAAGFLVWGYTLAFPSLVAAGLVPTTFIAHGPMGMETLHPFHLFGLEIGIHDMDHVSHAVFWSLLANIGVYVSASLFSRPTAMEHSQAALFVDVFQYSRKPGESFIWRGTATVHDLRGLLTRFLGQERTDDAFTVFARDHGVDWEKDLSADPALVSFAEKLLAGAIGSASARVMVSSVAKEEYLGIDEVMNILDETRQVILYSKELEKATTDLKAANERLKELDRLKDEFISTVTHELRTPLTSVRSLAEIVHDNPGLDRERLGNFSRIIINESKRLTRLITQVLDFQKIESGRMEWHMDRVDLGEVVSDAAAALEQMIRGNHIQLKLNLPENPLSVEGDRDRLIQVVTNLISNSIKFCTPGQGVIQIHLVPVDGQARVEVRDNGIGIDPEHQAIIFEKFRQIRESGRGRPSGSGLGLTITKQIIAFHNGEIWVRSQPGKGAVFTFTLPQLDDSPPPEGVV
jgi:Na+/proline symporter/signal transduction histidine kinase